MWRLPYGVMIKVQYLEFYLLILAVISFMNPTTQMSEQQLAAVLMLTLHDCRISPGQYH
ncbi:uncharacterized protein LAESUDRAFT_730744 [Laetiporus sulphureus 93-53]|uniref:Uncharacterized protein n=1 Tax=Laetiporus sulphureus 93-53 TaxID=1314785 RepID=A0A165BXX8_9APHY|nr:uncharacterized protein LAESUDRAFT_730744 [Laetiporus sulphureus 93-53]KZT01852.1 hypothetical protein LAESUDRAFT_730744 [Laetiporus sulphureus 93-53]